jgi:hypothetical protein
VRATRGSRVVIHRSSASDRVRVSRGRDGYCGGMSEHPTPAEDEGEQSEEHDAEERREAPDRDERTVTESGGYGTPERGTDD